VIHAGGTVVPHSTWTRNLGYVIHQSRFHSDLESQTIGVMALAKRTAAASAGAEGPPWSYDVWWLKAGQ
jgi:hypothetical protein